MMRKVHLNNLTLWDREISLTELTEQTKQTEQTEQTELAELTEQTEQTEQTELNWKFVSVTHWQLEIKSR